MKRGTVLAVAAVVALVGGGVLFVSGSAPGGAPDSPADSGTTTTVAEPSEETTRSDDSGRTGESDGETTTRATASPDYDFVIETIEECGSTCRDVTARLTNTRGAARRNVSVTTKMLADGELLWSGNETVGTLDAGESHVSTRRVKVGFSGGMAIRANDGYVTIVTVVESANGTTTFSERRKVA